MTVATCDFTVTVGPEFNVCFAETITVPSSLAGSSGFNVTVPSIAWNVEVCKGNGATLVLMVVMLGAGETGTPTMTAVA